MRFTLLLSCLSFTLVACTTIEDPSGPTTRGPQDEQAPISTTSDDPPGSATSCVQACRVAFEACGSTPEDRDLVRDCAASCPFTASEAACLSRLECGDDVSACD
jgi:hypothetical protein